ncbi:MAG: sodium:proton antiporter [Bryobacterales bacterium]|nr:sodium:proton antiporter [Bryobacterales bacterium]
MTTPGVGLATVIGAGIGAQWIAWRLRLPSILLLLLCGIALGPVSGLLNPDAIFGDLLLPLVAISVGIILFEGGLSLSFADLRDVGPVIRNLVTLGVLVNATLVALSAWMLLNLNWRAAMLVGAILSVTGPTVIQPLLRHIRPTPRVNSILKWEGILIDPVGALLAVLVFEVLLASSTGAHGFQFLEFGGLLIGGVLIGLLGAAFLVLLFRFHQVPDFLQGAFALALVIAVFSAANEWKGELGLLSTTAMGIALANQRFVSVRAVIEFKEHLRVVILSSLFVLLAARLQLAELQLPVWPAAAFLLVLILVVRPLAVLVSAARSELSRKEKLFIAWMAPRGIVAAAVASVFAERLAIAGAEDSGAIVQITFLTIIATVAVYGLSAAPLARMLGVSLPAPQGVLMLGGHDWARDIAEFLMKEKIRVVIVDSNWQNVTAARMRGIPAHYGGVLSKRVLDEIELYGLSRLLALTSNDEANSLAAVHFRDVFGQREVYQLAPARLNEARRANSLAHLRGSTLFGDREAFPDLAEHFSNGATLKKTKLTRHHDYKTFSSQQSSNVLPLFSISPTGTLGIFTADHQPRLHEGHTLISLLIQG